VTNYSNNFNNIVLQNTLDYINLKKQYEFTKESAKSNHINGKFEPLPIPSNTTHKPGNINSLDSNLLKDILGSEIHESLDLTEEKDFTVLDSVNITNFKTDFKSRGLLAEVPSKEVQELDEPTFSAEKPEFSQRKSPIKRKPSYSLQ